MAKSFATPAAFKASLEARLRALAAERGLPLNTVRLKLVIERLLARLFVSPSPPWLLKGGYAMELRYRPRARTTRDIDLTCSASGESELQAQLDGIREQLQAAAAADLGDHLTFVIGSPQRELQGAPLGGARFPCEAFLAGKTYGRFHIDLGFGDDPGRSPRCWSARTCWPSPEFLRPHPGYPQGPAVCREGARLHASMGRPREHAHQGSGGPGAADRDRQRPARRGGRCGSRDVRSPRNA